ncbi:hypothetical protein [Flavobacterium pedocola]
MKRMFFTALISSLALISCDHDSFVNSDVQNFDTERRHKLPNIEEAKFANSTVITNIYYGPPTGRIYVYLGREIDGNSEEEVRIERQTAKRVIMGITCIIQRDIVSSNNIIIEDTEDWLAQDRDQNLWYLGEFVKNYDEEGNFLDNDGSFEYGIDGALPGYWLPGNPTVGLSYYQEFYKGFAEDQAEVISIDGNVITGHGSYQGCLVTKDYSRFEPTVYELKYYAPGVGLVKEEKFEKKVLVEILELVDIVVLQ